jgi:hypothetical protein
MLPTLATNNKANCGKAYGIFNRQGSPSLPACASLTNAADRSGGEFGLSVPLANRCALFPCGIGHVVRSGAKKEMIRSHARWIVAMVAYIHAFGDRSVRQFPSNSMSAPGDGMANTDHAIAVIIPPRLPEPTRIGFLNLRPKAFFQRRNLSQPVVGGGSARLGTKDTLPVLDGIKSSKEGGGTLLADSGNGTLGWHGEPPIRCALPRAVDAAPGLQCANYTTGKVETAILGRVTRV